MIVSVEVDINEEIRRYIERVGEKPSNIVMSKEVHLHLAHEIDTYCDTREEKKSRIIKYFNSIPVTVLNIPGYLLMVG